MSLDTMTQSATAETAAGAATVAGPTAGSGDEWTAVCRYRQLQPERGAAALLDGEQVAIFLGYDGELFAVGNRDPINGAYVMSRGIVGSRGDVPTVSSPLHKQVYDLRTGECLDVPGVALRTYRVRCRDGMVEIATWRES